MNPSESIYVAIFNKFEDLIRGKIKEVKIALCEMNMLDYISIEKGSDGKLVRHNNYADVLRNFCKKYNIVQSEDLINRSYIFRLGDDKK